MTKLTKTIAKGTLGTVAAGAMALASATPAAADDNRYRDRGIDAGDIIAGAVVIGGIAALAGAFDKDRDHYRDSRYRDGRYYDRYDDRYDDGRFYNSRGAVERCVRTAEREARRNGYRYADVTEVYDLDRTRYGFRVKGRMQVEDGRGYGYRRHNSYDRGRFTCYVDGRGRPQIEFDGIRGLR